MESQEEASYIDEPDPEFLFVFFLTQDLSRQHLYAVKIIFLGIQFYEFLQMHIDTYSLLQSRDRVFPSP